MMNISSINKLPDKSPVDSVQGLVTKVFDQQQRTTKFGQTTVQGFILADATGEELRCEVWGQGDIGIYQGKEVILKQGKPGKGLSTSRQMVASKTGGEAKEYFKLSMSNAGQFQIVGGPNATAPAPAPAEAPAPAQTGAPAAKPAPPAPPTPAKSLGLVSGQAVGCSVNNAVTLMVYTRSPADVAVGLKDGSFWKSVKAIASDQIRVAQELEHGNLDSPTQASV